ncbi:hypothetical protein CPB86DRAFT_829861 [Serendipita vermifera]|nr:hypothetical protein CPB86DRAFT_829861 [Serendipita vermifera]
MSSGLILPDESSKGYTSENSVTRELEISERDLKTDASPPSGTTNNISVPILKQTKVRKGRRSRVPPDENCIVLDIEAIANRVRKSDFLAKDSLEPTIGSEDGIKLLNGYIASDIFTHANSAPKSVYWILIDEIRRKCRICGSVKSTPERTIGCKVWARAIYSAFPILLQGTAGGTSQKYDSTESLKRHWEAKHKENPFPGYSAFREHTPMQSMAQVVDTLNSNE